MSIGELLFLAILALLVFGPRKLPEIARVVGKVMTDLRRASNEFKYQMEEELRNIEVSEHRPAATPAKLLDAPSPVAGTVARTEPAAVATAEEPAMAAGAAAADSPAPRP